MRRFLPIVLAVIAVGALALVVSARPQLEEARDEVDIRWEALDAPLDERYALLAVAIGALGDAPGTAAPIVADLDEALTAWETAGDGQGSVAEGVAVANELEALSRRLDATVRASQQLTARPEVVAALDGLANAGAPPQADTFNRAVRDYADKRSGPLRGPIARVLGYDSIPTLDVNSE